MGGGPEVHSLLPPKARNATTADATFLGPLAIATSASRRARSRSRAPRKLHKGRRGGGALLRRSKCTARFWERRGAVVVVGAAPPQGKAIFTFQAQGAGH